MQVKVLLIIFSLLAFIIPAHAKTTYHCGYQGVSHMVMKKYVKDGKNIKDVDSHLKYKILKDNESGLIFAHGSTVGSFYYVVIFINKENMSLRRYSTIGNGETRRMNGSCRKE